MNSLNSVTENENVQSSILASPPEVQAIIEELDDRISQLVSVGTALSAERNFDRLLETILEDARGLCNADAGTLYLVSDDQKSLLFEIVQNDSMNWRMGGTSGKPINLPPVQLFDTDGQPNHANVSAHVAITGEIINIIDAYDTVGFDFSGTKAFDKNTGYRSKSFLVMPLRNHENEVIGVLQLINARRDPSNLKISEFSKRHEKHSSALASQAAIAITNNRLISDLKALFESLIHVIASAIDEKSPYTAGHITRVAELTNSIAEGISLQTSGAFKGVSFSDADLNELRLSAWLHDIGKITTPEYVVDKATKLETIFDRIHTTQARVEIIKRDFELIFYKTPEKDRDPDKLKAELESLEEDWQFIQTCNTGGEFMSDDKKERIKEISKRTLSVEGKTRPLLDENEIMNLCITKGTLTNEERDIINNHVSVSIKMLNQLPYPRKLKNIPRFAGAHHEKLDGSGYPLGLKGEDLPIQSRIMALADIFEALTAKDRPYKKGKTLSEALKIMGFMIKDQHIDGEIFQFFLDSGLCMKYAKKHLASHQIDEI